MRATFFLLTMALTVAYGQIKKNESKIRNDKYAFSFTVDLDYWKMADDKKIARKVNYDYKVRGVRTNYEYIFTTDNDTIVGRPAISVLIIPTEKNEFYSGKEKINQQVKISRRKGDKYFPDIDRILVEDSTFINEERQSMHFLSKNVKADVTYYSVSAVYYRDKYMLVFVLSTENLEPALYKFNFMTTSVEFTEPQK